MTSSPSRPCALSARAPAPAIMPSPRPAMGPMSDTTLRDVRVVIWLNDMPHTPAQRQAFERYMAGGGAWPGFPTPSAATPAAVTEFLGGARFAASNWPSLPARVNVEDAAHPTVDGVPPTFVAPIKERDPWTPSPRANLMSRSC